MNFLKLVPVCLVAWLLAAHFLRAENFRMVAFSLAFPCLLFLRYRWAARLVQGILLLGSVEWIRTLCVLTTDRQRAGEPWIRMAVILGSVALWTGGSVLVFRSRSLRERYALAHAA